METLLRMALVVCVLFHRVRSTDGALTKCQLPNSWKGRWWQSTLGDVVIKDSLISRKGVCVQHQGDKYLLYNRSDRCYLCLLIMERHRNLLQYKESFCDDEDSMDNVCRMIRVESPLYTLVREPNIRIRCPFQDAYYFNYNDHASGYCENPLSYAKPCVGQHQYTFHFKHCRENAQLHDMDTELECLATWKDGPDTYLYGQFSGPRISSKDDAYRCFKYKLLSNELHMAMSADPTCRGVDTAYDGPIVFTFTKDLHRSQSPTCEFPEWLWPHAWRDIEGQYSYTLSEDKGVMSTYYRKRTNSKPQLKVEFRCMERADNRDDKTVIILSFSTHRCTSKHECIKFVWKTENVIDMFQGGSVDSDRQTCEETDYPASNIILAEGASPQLCPSPSYYTIEPPTECALSLDVGCSSNTTIQLSSACADYEQVFAIECMVYWHGLGRTYIVARDLNRKSRLYNCFSFRERGSISEFGSDRRCNAGIVNLHNFVIRHSIVPYGHCDSIVKPKMPKDPTTRTIPSSTTTLLTTTTTTTTTTPMPQSIGSGKRPHIHSGEDRPPPDDDEDDDEEGSNWFELQTIDGIPSERDYDYPYSPREPDIDSRHINIHSPGSNTDDIDISDSNDSDRDPRVIDSPGTQFTHTSNKQNSSSCNHPHLYIVLCWILTSIICR